MPKWIHPPTFPKSKDRKPINKWVDFNKAKSGQIITSKGGWAYKKGYQKKILLDKIPGRIQSIQINKFKAGAIVPAHYHKKTYEIFYILSGNAIIKIDNKTYKCKPGVILTCKPKQIHSVINKSKSEFSLLTFKINAAKKDFYWVN